MGVVALIDRLTRMSIAISFMLILVLTKSTVQVMMVHVEPGLRQGYIYDQATYFQNAAILE